jgi:hypothetical protein
MAYLDQTYGGGSPMRTAATSGTQAPAAYTPKKGKWYDNPGYAMGDYFDPNSSLNERGWYVADPSVDYGPAPEAGLSAYFDREGNHAGWNNQAAANQAGGGSGLFGDFGQKTSFTDYSIDPTTGQMTKGGGTIDPTSKSGGTNFMSYAMPIAMMAGAGIAAAGPATMGAAAAETAGTAGTAGMQAMGADALAGVYGTAGESLVGGELLGQAGAAASSSWMSTAQELIDKGMDVKSAIDKAKQFAEVVGGDKKSGSGMSIADLIGGYYSGQQIKDLSGNLKGMYSDQRGLQNPYNELLRKSYEDPNVFYGSNQWKGLESVYQNRLDRGAAKAGTLANPTDREVKLNNYAMQELEKFRGGLREGVNAYDPTRLATVAQKGFENEAYANTGAFAGAAKGGTGTDIGKTWETIKNTGSTIADVMKFVEGWF